VQISNIPPFAKEETTVKEIATLVCQPLVVDELSLIKDEPVKVKINCRDSVAIRCGIEILFNKIGHTIKFIAEGEGARNLDPRGGPPGTGRKDDKHDKSGRRDQEDAENSKNRKRMGKFDKCENIDKEQDSNHGDSQEAMVGMALDDTYQKSNQNQEGLVPIAAYHPSTGHLKIMEKGKEGLVVSQIWNPTTDIVQYKSLQLSLPEEGNSKRVHSEVSAENTNTEDLEDEFGTIPKDQILVHGDSGPYLMNKDKWPNMPLSGKNNRTLNEDLSQGFCLQEMQGVR
jgi:hypothetical protein